MWWRIKTWARIQSRMMVFHLAEVYVYLEWPIRFLVNLLFLVTAPLWVGFAFVFYFLGRAYLSRKNVENQVIKGKIWFYEMFQIY